MSEKKLNLTNKLGTVHLFYCAVFSTIISVAGFMMSTTPEHYLLQALFLPITLFFDITLIGRIVNRKQGEAHHEFDIFEKKSYRRYILMIVLLIVLTAVALTNILKNSS